jgi:hypothetical protein
MSEEIVCEKPTKVKPGRREITDCITKTVIGYFVHKRQAVFRELGLTDWGKHRADVMSLALKKRTLTLVEVKSCHADFKGDLKFENYLPYCNVMYFAIPHDSKWIEPYRARLRELGIGIMALTSSGSLEIIQFAKRRTMKKREKYGLLVRLAYRCATFSPRTHTSRRNKTTDSGFRYQELCEKSMTKRVPTKTSTARHKRLAKRRVKALSGK